MNRSSYGKSEASAVVAPGGVDLHDAGGLEQSLHASDVVQGLPFVEPPLDLGLFRHPSLGVADRGLDMRRRNGEHAIRVPDDHERPLIPMMSGPSEGSAVSRRPS